VAIMSDGPGNTRIDESSRSRVDQDVEILIKLPGILKAFATPSGDLYVTIRDLERARTIALGSSEFNSWLTSQFYSSGGRAPSSESLNRARSLLETKARFESDPEEVYVRLGPGDEGEIYLDLGDSTGRSVCIDSHGWHVTDQPGIRFRRPCGLLPLPEPEKGGSVEELRPLINAGSEGNFKLIVGWLLSALQVLGPRFILVIEGEQGSAKSLTSRFLRQLIDPNQADLRSEPKNPQDLAVAAGNALVLAFDNISHISPTLSDGLCCISTGGGFSTRKLYTDKEEAIFEARRPILLNGIDAIASRGDLLDRSLLLKLPRIEQYREERELFEGFEAARPRILGALLTAVSASLRNVSSVNINERLRMIDAATWVTAAEESLAWTEGSFLAAMKENADEAVEQVFDASLVAGPIMDLVRDVEVWDGTASELLEEISRRAPGPIVSSRYWPNTPRLLANELRRLSPDFRKRGIASTWTRRNSRREIHLWLDENEESIVTMVTMVTDGPSGVRPNGESDHFGDHRDHGDDGFGKSDGDRDDTIPS
jgi:hypothetical protein